MIPQIATLAVEPTVVRVVQPDSTWLDLFTALGNLAVIITLIVLVYQVRQDRKASAHVAGQVQAQALNTLYLSLAQDADLAAIYRTGRKTPERLDEPDSIRFFYLCVLWFSHHENTFMQDRSGALPRTYFDAWDEALRDDLLDPGLRQYWTEENTFYDSDFREYIDATFADLDAARESRTSNDPSADESSA